MSRHGNAHDMSSKILPKMNRKCRECGKKMWIFTDSRHPWQTGAGTANKVWCSPNCFDKRFPWAPYEGKLPWNPKRS